MGKGVIEQIDAANTQHYDEFSLYKLEEVLTELANGKPKSSMVLHTGQKGYDDFEVNMNRQLDVERFQRIFPKHTKYTSFDFGLLPLDELRDFIKEIEE